MENRKLVILVVVCLMSFRGIAQDISKAKMDLRNQLLKPKDSILEIKCYPTTEIFGEPNKFIFLTGNSKRIGNDSLNSFFEVTSINGDVVFRGLIFNGVLMVNTNEYAKYFYKDFILTSVTKHFEEIKRVNRELGGFSLDTLAYKDSDALIWQILNKRKKNVGYFSIKLKSDELGAQFAEYNNPISSKYHYSEFDNNHFAYKYVFEIEYSKSKLSTASFVNHKYQLFNNSYEKIQEGVYSREKFEYWLH